MERKLPCPVMEHIKGYNKTPDTNYCCYDMLRKMIPAGYSCCTKDKRRCLIVQIPSQKEEYKNLVEEINLCRYYKMPIDELYIRRQMCEFFASIGASDNKREEKEREKEEKGAIEDKQSRQSV